MPFSSLGLLKVVLSTSALECALPSALGGQSCHLWETLGLPDRDLGKNEQEKRTPELCEGQAGGPWGNTLESTAAFRSDGWGRKGENVRSVGAPGFHSQGI